MGALLIVNPKASKVSDELVDRVAGELPSDTLVLHTRSAREAGAIAEEYESSVDAIYIFSGDGTYNEVLNSVGGAVPLGFVPGGGTSVLPRALGLGRDPVAAARLAASGVPRRIGLGRVNGRRFAFNAGIGFDAELVRRIDECGRDETGRRPGDLAFVRAALGMIASRRGRFPSALEIEGVGRAAFALVANTEPYTYFGRVPVRLSRGASFDLGLDLVAPSALRAHHLPRFLLTAVRGARPRAGVVVLHDVGRILIRCDAPMPLQVDGEDVGDVVEATFETEPNAVTVLGPA